jgi:hypothetical protein
MIENPPYNAVIVRGAVMNNPQIRVKLYYVDLKDRDPRCEWGGSGLSQEGLGAGIERLVLEDGHQGVPRIAVSFPHVTAIWRWGDPVANEQETNIVPVGIGETPRIITEPNYSLKPIRQMCPMEQVILAQEAVLWAKSTVRAYMEQGYQIRLGPETRVMVAAPNKLRRDLGLR